MTTHSSDEQDDVIFELTFEELKLLYEKLLKYQFINYEEVELRELVDKIGKLIEDEKEKQHE